MADKRGGTSRRRWEAQRQSVFWATALGAKGCQNVVASCGSNVVSSHGCEVATKEFTNFMQKSNHFFGLRPLGFGKKSYPVKREVLSWEREVLSGETLFHPISAPRIHCSARHGQPRTEKRPKTAILPDAVFVVF